MLAIRKEIKLNQNIRINRKDMEGGWYVSSVQDITKNDFSISVPTRGLDPLVLNRGDVVKVTLFSETAKVEFETRVLGWRSDNIQLYALAMPKEYKFIQLREFVRISSILDVSYAEITDTGELSEFVSCNSLDLSGGGIRLLLKKDYSPGSKLKLRIKIPLEPSVEVEAIGKVVRTWPQQIVNQFQVAVQFTDIRRRQQDLIIRYIFNKMSQQRRLS